jgi:putative acetyltransferase
MTAAADIAIRPTPPDHPQVLALLAALDAYLASLYEPEANHILGVEALKSPEVTFLAAWRGDEVVGCGAVRTMVAEPETDGCAYGEIKRMFVLPQQRGQRIAARLIEALEAALRVKGIERALLETGSDQTEAVRLYARMGYLPRGPFGGYPDNGLSLFMEKRWSPT